MIYPITMFAAKCDCCGEEFEFFHGYGALVDELSVQEEIGNSSWYNGDDNNHYCPACYSYDHNDKLVLKRNPTK